MTNKRELSEQDICTRYILPALVRSGWDISKQVREQVYFTDGRIYLQGNRTKRGQGKKADYILYYKRILFLADRTSLISQTKGGDFKHFTNKMTVIKHKKIDQKRVSEMNQGILSKISYIIRN